MVRSLFGAALIGAALLSQAAAQPALPPLRQATAAQIDRNGTMMLIRSSLLALSQANQTGNYTVLRDLGSPEFQQANTASRLSDIFKVLRAQALDLSGVAVLEPELTQLPEIQPNGRLHMAGFFPSVPLQVRFDIAFAPTGSQWKLANLSVSFASPMPAPAQAEPSEVRKSNPQRKPTNLVEAR